MLDFPVFSGVAPKSAWILSGSLYFFILLYYNRWALSHPLTPTKYSSKKFFVLLFFIYCILAIYSGDWIHMQTIVKEMFGNEYTEGIGLEPIYYLLVNAIGGNYLVFRIIVWGSGLLLLFESFKHSNLDPYRCLFFLFGIYITTFAYTRAGAALACFYCGFVLLFKDKGHRTLLFSALGIALIVASTFLHRSMLILAVISPLSIIPFNKRTTPVVIIGTVVLLFMGRGLFENALNYLSSTEEYSHRIELYESLAGDRSFSSILDRFFYLWYKIIVHLPFLFCVFHLYKLINKGVVPSNIQSILTFSIMLYVFMMVMLFQYGSNSAFYYRYEGMLYIPITIMMSFLFQNKYISVKKYSLIFWICALSQCKDFIYRIVFW